MLLLAACEPLKLAPLTAPNPDMGTVATKGGRPIVTMIVGTRADDKNWFVTYSFNHPMEISATESRLRLAAVNGEDGAKFALDPGIEPDNVFGFVWDTTGSTVTVRYPTSASRVWRPVVLQGARDTAGTLLDGTAALPVSAAGNLARSADDGFSGPSTHVGLPMYPKGTDTLLDHPRYRLHNDRPGVRVTGFAQGVTLPMFVAEKDNTVVTLPEPPARLWITLRDFNWRPISDPVEPHDQALLAPDSLTAVEITDQRGDPVDFRATWDQEGRLQVGSSLTVTYVASGDLFVGLDAFGNYRPDLPGHTVLDRSFGKNDENPFAYWKAVTGGIRFQAVPVSGSGTGIPGVAKLHVTGRSWRQDEWALFQVQLGTFPYKIIYNTSSTFTMNVIPSCLPACDFAIHFNPGMRFSKNMPVQLLSDTAVLLLQEYRAHPLPWTIRIRGGKDGLRSYRGLPLYDRVRDGEEPDGPVNDDVVFSLQGRE